MTREANFPGISLRFWKSRREGAYCQNRDDIVTSTPNDNTSQDFTSIKASRVCRAENAVLSPPLWSFANLIEATSRSLVVRNQAASGPLGIAKKKRTPQAQFEAPLIRKSILQGARASVKFLPTPNISNAPALVSL